MTIRGCGDAVQAAGLPILNLEIEQIMQSFEGARNRLQAYAEQIESRRRA